MDLVYYWKYIHMYWRFSAGLCKEVENQTSRPIISWRPQEFVQAYNYFRPLSILLLSHCKSTYNMSTIWVTKLGFIILDKNQKELYEKGGRSCVAHSSCVRLHSCQSYLPACPSRIRSLLVPNTTCFKIIHSGHCHKNVDNVLRSKVIYQ